VAGPAGYALRAICKQMKQCAVVASRPGIGRTWLEPCLALRRAIKQKISLREFLASLWLSKIKQALTIYKEEMRRMFSKLNAEDS